MQNISMDKSDLDELYNMKAGVVQNNPVLRGEKI